MYLDNVKDEIMDYSEEKQSLVDIGLGATKFEIGSSLRILVLGVGGAGCNAVNNMLDPETMEHSLDGIEFLVANCDAQALSQSLCERTIQLGANETSGLGAGSNPEKGRLAAEESKDQLKRAFEGINMLFITAGMGGGTGTGATPIIAEIAKDMGILTVAVITKPFDFEGEARMRVAEQGILELEKYVDSLIVVPNQNLFTVADENTSFAEAFFMADQVLTQGVWGITSLMLTPGIVNLDFNDIKSAMEGGGHTMLGTGEAEGEDRALEAAQKAIANPLLETKTLDGAQNVLINITGSNLRLFEVEKAFSHIREQVGLDAAVNYGAAIDESLQGRIRVLVVATGIKNPRSAAGHHVQNITHKSPMLGRKNIIPEGPSAKAARAFAPHPARKDQAPEQKAPVQNQTRFSAFQQRAQNVQKQPQPQAQHNDENFFIPDEPIAAHSSEHDNASTPKPRNKAASVFGLKGHQSDFEEEQKSHKNIRDFFHRD